MYSWLTNTIGCYWVKPFINSSAIVNMITIHLMLNITQNLSGWLLLLGHMPPTHLPPPIVIVMMTQCTITSLIVAQWNSVASYQIFMEIYSHLMLYCYWKCQKLLVRQPRNSPMTNCPLFPLLWISLNLNTIWFRSWNCGCLVTWFCYQLIAKPGNKTATVLWPDPYHICNKWNIFNFFEG